MVLSVEEPIHISKKPLSMPISPHLSTKSIAKTLKAETYAKNRQQKGIRKLPDRINPAYVFLLRRVARSRANDHSIEMTQVATQRVFVFVFEQIEVIDLYTVDIRIDRSPQ